MSVDREQIRREATRVIERSEDAYTEWAEWCLALLGDLEQAEKVARFHELDAKQQHAWVHRLEDALQKAELELNAG